MLCTFRKLTKSHGYRVSDKQGEIAQAIGRSFSKWKSSEFRIQKSEVEKMIVTLLLFFLIVGSAAFNPSTVRPGRYVTYLRSSVDAISPTCNGYSVRDSWALVVGKFSSIEMLVVSPIVMELCDSRCLFLSLFLFF